MIDRETLTAVADAVAGRPLDEALLADLKGRFPSLHLTLCGDDDVPARLPAVLERPGFNLYLVNGSEHCLTLTNDPDVAIGVVLAWVSED
ncbi:MAG: DUF6129 family protein [Pseudomonadota bacterium]